MATINVEILQAAFEDGFIRSDLTPNERLYLPPSVSTCAKILSLLEDEWLDAEQLSSRLRLNSHTVSIYCSWLVKVKILIYDDGHEGRRQARIYAIKPERSLNPLPK